MALWKDIKEEITLQLNQFRPFIGLAGSSSAGKIKLRRVTELTAGDELYAILRPFAPNVNDESVWIVIGGKPVCLGKLSRIAGPAFYTGAGSPEGVIAASMGSIYLRTDGAAGTTLYIKESGSGNTGWMDNRSYYTVTLGPFYINDLPGTASTPGSQGYFDTATTVKKVQSDPIMQSAGRVVGILMNSDAARTAGTATAQVLINSAPVAFNGGACQLSASPVVSDGSFVAYASGVPFTASETVGVEVVTSGWTPITANLTLFVIVALDPF